MIAPPDAPASPAPCLTPEAKAIAIVGPSNSGKTGLICGLLKWFATQQIKVAVLKHSHKNILGDEGKDTGRFRAAGGGLVALAAPGLLQINRACAGEPKLAAILAELAPEVDLILTEGYKTSDLPKIGVVGPNLPRTLPDYPRLVAWVSPLALPTNLPVFHPAQVADLGRFIQARLGSL
ncbi:MAG: molybdopterin-guanine dinucleotide biosynthesis protein B [Deltaproteobacteria bacterium]